MSRVNRPPGDWRYPDWEAPEPVAAQPNPQANVTDPHPDKLLYGPRGNVIARVRDGHPIGFHR